MIDQSDDDENEKPVEDENELFKIFQANKKYARRKSRNAWISNDDGKRSTRKKIRRTDTRKHQTNRDESNNLLINE